MDTSAIRAAYDRWAAQYDTDENATRDLNARRLREQTFLRPDDVVLELGCGTGLNTEWLARQAGRVVAVDVSAEMLARARRRLTDAPVTLRTVDVTEPWPFDDGAFDAVVATLVLEHVERLGPVFREAHRVLRPGGHVHLAELHPYRQWGGTQAHFEHEASGEHVVVEAFPHPVSAFVNEGIGAGFTVRRMGEWRGPDDETPRLLSIRFRA